MKRLLSLLSFCLVLVVSCISDFTPEVKGTSGILVVDGMITNGESVFRLGRSVSVTDTLFGNELITNASMSVERSDGVSWEAKTEKDGYYHIWVGELDPDLAYRLNFTLDGKQYQSSFLKPMLTAEITSLSYQKDGIGKPVGIYLSCDGGANTSVYYRWSYLENWELHTSLFAKQGYVNGKLTDFDLRTANNRYYCWGRDSSKALLLETTKGLLENRVEQKRLYELPCSDEKLSILYHVEVSQTQLREDAYDYYRCMQDAVERTGGLFNLVMSAGDNGNIVCLSDPKEIVIGYVEVTNTTKKSMYISSVSRDIYEPPMDYCWIREKGDQGMQLPWVDYYEKTYATWNCVDCREHYNATKNKPSWWPTDHL